MGALESWGIVWAVSQASEQLYEQYEVSEETAILIEVCDSERQLLISNLAKKDE